MDGQSPPSELQTTTRRCPSQRYPNSTATYPNSNTTVSKLHRNRIPTHNKAYTHPPAKDTQQGQHENLIPSQTGDFSPLPSEPFPPSTWHHPKPERISKETFSNAVTARPFQTSSSDTCMQDARRVPNLPNLAYVSPDLASLISPELHPARDLAVLQPGLSLPCPTQVCPTFHQISHDHRARYLEALHIRGATWNARMRPVRPWPRMFCLRASRRCSRDPKGGEGEMKDAEEGGSNAVAAEIINAWRAMTRPEAERWRDMIVCLSFRTTKTSDGEEETRLMHVEVCVSDASRSCVVLEQVLEEA
ncbi:hypothetical protein QBC34DRAFT_222564 [Podospora aff. communis PSN243]|uniref:HMG box domain-containing protein n=1 Tax=Podospora aff. communis PSN243 TaxID=3040156 RepID=A0AAV9G6B7_9PEZI|nr:hypothetical protein QBC34DRAFT_222564 [Podospora aff. communis PSN243]